MNRHQRPLLPQEGPTNCEDPAYWERVLEAEGLAVVRSLFEEAAFDALDEEGRAIKSRISSYGGNDCASGFPIDLEQLRSLIQEIINEWPKGTQVGLCIKTSCTTGDLKVVVYQKGVDGPRYHYNLRDIEALTVEKLQNDLEKKFLDLNVKISST